MHLMKLLENVSRVAAPVAALMGFTRWSTAAPEHLRQRLAALHQALQASAERRGSGADAEGGAARAAAGFGASL